MKKTKDSKERKGRAPGFQHSQETKEKMREKRLNPVQPDIRTFTLEEILSQAKGDIEKSLEVYNLGLAGVKVEVVAYDHDDDWLLGYYEFEHNLIERISKMLNWPQTKYIKVKTIGEPQKELTGILKVEDKYIILGDYDLAIKRREGRTSLLDKEIGKG